VNIEESASVWILVARSDKTGIRILIPGSDKQESGVGYRSIDSGYWYNQVRSVTSLLRCFIVPLLDCSIGSSVHHFIASSLHRSIAPLLDRAHAQCLKRQTLAKPSTLDQWSIRPGNSVCACICAGVFIMCNSHPPMLDYVHCMDRPLLNYWWFLCGVQRWSPFPNHP
jgi:hypothetical protein